MQSAGQPLYLLEPFAARFDFSTATLHYLKRGNRTPRGPPPVLLYVIERNLKAVIEALAQQLARMRRTAPRGVQTKTTIRPSISPAVM